MNEHYDVEYFNWQKRIGAFGGWAELIKFEEFITPEMRVVDFGCGGGFLLHNIVCREKIGIEVNEAARETLSEFGIKSLKCVTEVPDDWADCVISNHALEHVTDPFNQISLLKKKLKPGGKIIFVVPKDSFSYKPNDINFHLYSWSAMNLGNLFTQAGYTVIESKEFVHKWPPYYEKIASLFGKKGFHIVSKFYGRLRNLATSQVRIVAIKPMM